MYLYGFYILWIDPKNTTTNNTLMKWKNMQFFSPLQVCTAVDIVEKRSHHHGNYEHTFARTQENVRLSVNNVGRSLYWSITSKFTCLPTSTETIFSESACSTETICIESACSTETICIESACSTETICSESACTTETICIESACSTETICIVFKWISMRKFLKWFCVVG